MFSWYILIKSFQSSCEKCSTTSRDYSTTETKCNYQTENCIQCDKGYVNEDLTCNIWGVGIYTDTHTATVCSKYSSITYQEEEGKSSCTECDKNCLNCVSTNSECTSYKESYYSSGTECKYCW